MQKNSVAALVLLIVTLLFSTSSPGYVKDEGNEIVVMSVEDEAKTTSSPCTQARFDTHRLWCQALLCQAEHVVNACCLSGEDLSYHSQSSGDETLIIQPENTPPEEQAFHILSFDVSTVERKLRAEYSWPEQSVANGGCFYSRQYWSEALRYSLAGCELRLLACGANFNPTTLFPGYLFKECMVAIDTPTQSVPPSPPCSPCPPKCGGSGYTEIN